LSQLEEPSEYRRSQKVAFQMTKFGKAWRDQNRSAKENSNLAGPENW